MKQTRRELHSLGLEGIVVDETQDVAMGLCPRVCQWVV